MSARYLVESLAAAQAITASGNTRATDMCRMFDHVTVYINVSAVSGTTPSMTPTVQVSPDNGTTWYGNISMKDMKA